MDLRIRKRSKLRILEPEDTANAVSAFQAEAIAKRAIEKLRPKLIWIYSFRRRLATISVLVLTMWLFAHVMLGANGMMVYRTKRAEVRNLQKEIDSLQKENDRYSKQIDDLKTDPKTIEKEAREQLHYARPGEVVYVTPPAPVQDTPRIDSAQKQTQSPP